MKKNRLIIIDYLRGYAIILMILMHSLAYFTKDSLAYFLWDISHYVVPLIIFSSTYVFLRNDFKFNVKNYLEYVKKRIFRLLIPYYVFLLSYSILLKIFEPNKLDIRFIINSITLSGGVDISWLVVLFIYITFLLPIICLLAKKHSFLYVSALFFSILTTVYFLFFPTPFDYRIIMWAPWLTVVFFAFSFAKLERNDRNLILITIIIFIIYLISRKVLLARGGSLIYFKNKYPPNIYYIAYGMWQIGISYQIFKKWLLGKRAADKFFYFFSKNSYSLFFIHYIVIYLTSKLYKYWEFNWTFFVGLIFIVSIFAQVMINKFVFMVRNYYYIKYERKSF